MPPAALAAGRRGRQYDDFLLAAGGQAPYTWTLVSGSLPGGLTLTPAGEITGTITGSSGTFNFVVQVADNTDASPVQESFSIQVSGVALAFAGVAAASAGAGAGRTITVAATVTNSGTQADNVVPIIAVNTTGYATASCGPRDGIRLLGFEREQRFHLLLRLGERHRHFELLRAVLSATDSSGPTSPSARPRPTSSTCWHSAHRFGIRDLRRQPLRLGGVDQSRVWW